VKEVSDEESAERCCEKAHVEVTAAVETRAMKMKQKSPPNPLDVPKLAAIEVITEQFQRCKLS